MKKVVASIFLLSICTTALMGAVKASTKSVVVEVENNWNKAKSDEPVVLKISDLKTGFVVKSATVWDGEKEIPSQLDDLNSDRKADELAFLINIDPQTKKTFKVVLSDQKSDKKYPSRVFAEMLVSDKKRKARAHSFTHHSGYQQHLQSTTSSRSGIRIGAGSLPTIL